MAPIRNNPARVQVCWADGEPPHLAGTWRTEPDFERFVAGHLRAAEGCRRCLLEAVHSQKQIAHPGRRVQVAEGEPADSGNDGGGGDELAGTTPLGSLTCHVSTWSRAQYHAFAMRTRRCASSELLWFTNYVHWTKLVGEANTLVVPFKVMQSRRDLHPKPNLNLGSEYG